MVKNGGEKTPRRRAPASASAAIGGDNRLSKSHETDVPYPARKEPYPVAGGYVPLDSGVDDQATGQADQVPPGVDQAAPGQATGGDQAAIHTTVEGTQQKGLLGLPGATGCSCHDMPEVMADDRELARKGIPQTPENYLRRRHAALEVREIMGQILPLFPAPQPDESKDQSKAQRKEQRQAHNRHVMEIAHEMIRLSQCYGVPDPRAVADALVERGQPVGMGELRILVQSMIPQPPPPAATVAAAEQQAGPATECPARKKRGRPADTDRTQDSRWCRDWKASVFSTHKDFCDARGIDIQEFELAMDRERKRSNTQRKK